MKKITFIFVVILCALISLTCDESLPTRIFPDRVLAVEVSFVEQLPDREALPGSQLVHTRLTGENVYDEVFQDPVNIKGSLTIWWKRLPRYYRTIELGELNISTPDLIHGSRMTLLPGQKFSMDVFWNIKTDDSLYLPFKMNFARTGQRLCSPNVICADPEVFVIESSVTIFDRLGWITIPAKEFTFVARACRDCGVPPCPTPPGGCG